MSSLLIRCERGKEQDVSEGFQCSVVMLVSHHLYDTPIVADFILKHRHFLVTHRHVLPVKMREKRTLTFTFQSQDDGSRQRDWKIGRERTTIDEQGEKGEGE